MSDSLNPTPDAEQLMFGAIPGKPALGRGPAVNGGYSRHPYHHPAAGWGAAESVASVLARAGEPIEGFRAIFVMNPSLEAPPPLALLDVGSTAPAVIGKSLDCVWPLTITVFPVT